VADLGRVAQVLHLPLAALAGAVVLGEGPLAVGGDAQPGAVEHHVVLGVSSRQGDHARRRGEAALDDLRLEPGDPRVVVDPLAVLFEQPKGAVALVLDADLLQDVQGVGVEGPDLLVAQDADLRDHGRLPSPRRVSCWSSIRIIAAAGPRGKTFRLQAIARHALTA